MFWEVFRRRVEIKLRSPKLRHSTCGVLVELCYLEVSPAVVIFFNPFFPFLCSMQALYHLNTHQQSAYPLPGVTPGGKKGCQAHQEAAAAKAKK